MTKDWNLVQDEIKELSFGQKKPLEEVKAIMESKHNFRASTRAYRMKLAEWGLTRRTKSGGMGPTRLRRTREGSNTQIHQEGNAESLVQEEMDTDVTLELEVMDGQETSSTQVEQNITPTLDLLDGAEDLLPSTTPTIDPCAQGRAMTTNIVTEMLAAVLDGDSQTLEELIRVSPNHINLPIGVAFDAHTGRFFNHPAIAQCVVLEHENQTLLDIASALPAGPVVWVLIAHGAKGSRHPLGTDLALHNAIKNGRAYTVQSLLQPGGSDVNGVPGVPWRPILQASFWNVPDVVRILLDRGANANDTMPATASTPAKTALQFCLTQRMEKYADQTARERSGRILKMLLDAGAGIDAPPGTQDPMLEPFQMLLKPWQHDPHWIAKISTTEIDCLESFVRKGVNLQSTFIGFPCSAASGHTFEHQVLWHSTPTLARLLIDHAFPAPGASGSNLLPEIMGCCPDTKRHPADTLRDMEVLLRRGANPNTPGTNGDLPLRNCIERCPAVDVIPRLKALLDAGADPELKDRNGVLPFVLAARAFDEPLATQILHLMVEKCRGRYTYMFHSISSSWSPSYFPIVSDPAFAQVMWYSGQNGDFMANLQRMMPKDMQSLFQRAAFSVASQHFFDATTRRARSVLPLPLHLSPAEKDEISQVVAMRQTAGLPDYQFEQAFVMSLLMPSAPLLLPHQTPVSCTAAMGESITALAPASFEPPASSSSTPRLPPSDVNLDKLPSRHSSAASEDSTSSFLVSSTTQISWSAIGRATRPEDVETAKSATLMHKCPDCKDTNLLTKAEFERHEEEHWHTMACEDEGCRRRFCVAERG